LTIKFWYSLDVECKEGLKEEKIPTICYHVPLIEIGWANDRLSMHGKIIFIYEGWKGAWDAQECFLYMVNGKLYA
jgi:hypothetical protein